MFVKFSQYFEIERFRMTLNTDFVIQTCDKKIAWIAIFEFENEIPIVIFNKEDIPAIFNVESIEKELEKARQKINNSNIKKK